jgi:hypothetical protein
MEMETTVRKRKSPVRVIANSILVFVIAVWLIVVLIDVYKNEALSPQVSDVGQTVTISPTSIYMTANTNIDVSPTPGGIRVIVRNRAVFDDVGRSEVPVENGPSYTKWFSRNMKVTSDGKITGKIETEYPEPEKAVSKQYIDILFLGMFSQYPVGNFGDFKYISLGDIMPIISDNSTPQNATFTINGKFDTTKKDSDSAVPIEIGLTWVRIYNENGTLFLQVMPGSTRYVTYDGTRGRFLTDTQVDYVDGEVDYYEPFNEILLKKMLELGYHAGHEDIFNYYKWIKNNIKF